MRPWLLIIVCKCVFTSCHGSHSVKKERIIPQGFYTSANITHHNHLRNFNEQQRILSKSHLSKSNEAPTQQRIVILAGPHKTASSSIQHNIYIWSSNDPQILPNWAWPVPYQVLEFSRKIETYRKGYFEAKAFYPLVQSLTDGSSDHRPIFAKYSKQLVMDFYRDAFEGVWKEGYNLVLGAEALDFLVADRIDKHRMLDKFCNVLPLKQSNNSDDGIVLWGANEKDVTVVVNFRAPRVEHLISIYHQCCTKNTNRISFMEFLITLPNSENIERIRALDALAFSKVFLKRGFNVVLIDMSGISTSGYDISNIVACDILKANCTETKEIVTIEKKEEERIIPVTMNVKHNKGNMEGITDKQLDEIEKVLRKYDCNYQHVLQHEKLTVLYSYELDRIMADCSKTKAVGEILNRQELVEKIRNVAMDSDGNSDETRYTNIDVNGA